MIQIHTCRRNRTSKYLKWTMILQKTIFWIRISTCSSQISLMHTIAIIKYIILRIKAKHKMAGIIKFNTKIHSVKLNSQPTHFKKFSSFNRSRRNIPSSLKELSGDSRTFYRIRFLWLKVRFSNRLNKYYNNRAWGQIIIDLVEGEKTINNSQSCSSRQKSNQGDHLQWKMLLTL